MYPFHISLEGIEQKILCRETDDYDCFVKIIQICALRKDVIVIMYVVVSNHAHIVVLAESQKAADDYGDEIKRMYSMHFSRKYGGRSVMKHLDAKAIYIDSDWYLAMLWLMISETHMTTGRRMSSHTNGPVMLRCSAMGNAGAYAWTLRH